MLPKIEQRYTLDFRPNLSFLGQFVMALNRSNKRYYREMADHSSCQKVRILSILAAVFGIRARSKPPVRPPPPPPPPPPTPLGPTLRRPRPFEAFPGRIVFDRDWYPQHWRGQADSEQHRPTAARSMHSTSPGAMRAVRIV